jgi:hypothetical protein
MGKGHDAEEMRDSDTKEGNLKEGRKEERTEALL